MKQRVTIITDHEDNNNRLHNLEEESCNAYYTLPTLNQLRCTLTVN